MSGSTRRRLKSEVSRGNNIDDVDEGTAARTRPLSYDEIMLKRKSKKELTVECTRDEVREAKSSRHEVTITNSGYHSRDTIHDVKKNSRDYAREETSRKKEEKISRMEDTHVKSTNKENHEAEGRAKHKHEKTVRNSTDMLKYDSRAHGRSKVDNYSRDESRYDNVKRHYRDSIAQDRYMERSKGALEKENRRKDQSGEDAPEKENKRKDRNGGKAPEKENNRTDRTREDAFEKENKRKDQSVENAPEKENKRKDRSGEDAPEKEKKRKDRSGEDALEKENKRKDRSGEDAPKKENKRNDRSGEDAPKKENKRKDRSGDDAPEKENNRTDRSREYAFEKENKRKDWSGENAPEKENKRKDRSGENASEKENKRKDRSVEDEKYRLRSSVQKHDSGNKRDSELSERKEKMDLSRSHHDERRSKRRRSRSQDHFKDKGRRSRSLSPKTQRNVSSHGHEHDQLSLHSQRDKSGRHFDVDRNNKMSTNGSTSHHRRHGGSSSGLGGYSPRKRKSEAAVKTPSPIRSPEKKSTAGWDLPPSGADRKPGPPVTSAPPLLSQTKTSNMSELATSTSVSSAMEKPLSAILPSNMPAFNMTSIDSIQLTQATRPMRRLYVDNIPASASEKAIMECFNDFLVSSGANRILGRRPCISCMIHKEKGQALVEFLTPEDASSALYFDGRSVFGSIVKIRRPKDFVEVPSIPAYNIQNRNYENSIGQSGPSERSTHGDDAISDIVKDSPHKIFIGGIAEGLSSEMIMEIVGAFGPLKAYHMEINANFNERCAFIEYVDQSITLKACAGLNGMKLGGRILTVAQAVPNSSLVEKSENIPFYGIPEHVKPLLEMPTPVLKLVNVLDEHTMKSLSETDLEEIVEDVRLECSRFGSVVSINVTRTSKRSEKTEGSDDMKALQPAEDRDPQDHPVIEEVMEAAVEHGDGTEVDPSSNVEEYTAGDNAKEGEKPDLVTVIPTADIGEGTAERGNIQEGDEIVNHNSDDEAGSKHTQVLGMGTVEYVGRLGGSDVNNQEHELLLNDGGRESELYPNEDTSVDKLVDDKPSSVEDVPGFGKTSDQLDDSLMANSSVMLNQEATENGVKDENPCDFQDMFEVGCVLVEFKRTEAACVAAHCLHGRAFDDRVVEVQYVPLDAYRLRFPK